ncbi:MAG: hypothetical protein M1828_007121 [Chrysothrix sp. TS-e1954]|nr:MAG: hypothetical protein M1828_007121 [Chrysothrix sp. TS-e1954]
MARDDPFDSLFSLEDTYYEEGFKQGFADGVSQSGLEARVFGVEKGFEKFLDMGRLQARAKVWSARMLPPSQEEQGAPQSLAVDDHVGLSSQQPPTLPTLQNHSRLSKHVHTLEALVDSTSLSMRNSDDSVGDFDDRLKRAQAKVKIIEKLIGEEGATSRITSDGRDAGVKSRPLRDEANMEDFGG